MVWYLIVSFPDLCVFLTLLVALGHRMLSLHTKSISNHIKKLILCKMKNIFANYVTKAYIITGKPDKTLKNRRNKDLHDKR